ncbi:MAG: OsmC family protein [Alphaproteobacteria bacterium]|nr:OsmC family protein [Alphaproteobacteria bacterium]
MSEHHAGVAWTRTTPTFTYESYDRSHEIRYKDGAVIVGGSAAPAFKGDGTRIDPEEQFVASLSACHMLSFLAIAARKRLTVDSYRDEAIGVLEKGGRGRLQITRVILRPVVQFSDRIEPDVLARMHHLAHEECFIANSVTTEVSVEPQS